MPEAVPEALEVRGRVVEALPGALYRVELLTGTRALVTAHVAGEGRLLRVRVGEEVRVEILAYDTTRARIVARVG
jgi:translation initiation factor IF-1